MLTEGYIAGSSIIWEGRNGMISVGIPAPSPPSLEALLQEKCDKQVFYVDRKFYVFLIFSGSDISDKHLSFAKLVSKFEEFATDLLKRHNAVSMEDAYIYSLIHRFFRLSGENAFHADLSINDNLVSNGFRFRKENNALRIGSRVYHPLILSFLTTDIPSALSATPGDSMCILLRNGSTQLFYNLHAPETGYLLEDLAAAKEFVHDIPGCDYSDPNNYVQNRNVLESAIPGLIPPKLIAPCEVVA